jgi:hypothetical protein
MKMDPVVELAYFPSLALASLSFIVTLPFTEIRVSVIVSTWLFSPIVVCMLFTNLVPRSAPFVLQVGVNSRSDISWGPLVSIAGRAFLAWWPSGRASSLLVYFLCLLFKIVLVGRILASAIKGAIGVDFMHPVIAPAVLFSIFWMSSSRFFCPLYHTSDPKRVEAWTVVIIIFLTFSGIIPNCYKAVLFDFRSDTPLPFACCELRVKLIMQPLFQQ